MSKTYIGAMKIRAELEAQINEFFAKGGEVQELGVTQLKRVPLVLNPHKIQSLEKTKPVRV